MRIALLLLVLRLFVPSSDGGEFRLAAFSADVTVPIGHGMMGGSWKAASVADPLFAHGIVLTSASDGAAFLPVVYVAVDWCEIRNDALERWQAVLAEAAGTKPERVMVSAVHQHEAPVADLAAERILRANGAKGSICDLEFHEQAVQRVARALRESLSQARRVTHTGTGQAKVDKVASNRRFVMPGGLIRFDRMSRCRDVAARAAEEGLIDPWLKTLSFWDGDTPIAALSAYAVHPMSYYGTGEISADFPGMARALRQAELPGARQIYLSGASGNVTAGKYNDGSRENRAVLAARLHAAMKAAWESTERHPLKDASFRSVDLRLDPRDGPGWTVPDLTAKLGTDKPFEQCLASMGLSWRKRIERPIQIPALHLGTAVLLVVPGEAYVEYQLFAQEQRRDAFVVTAGYGEGAPGYIPTEQHFRENDTNLGDWCWVAPGSEEKLKAAIRDALAK
jgi:hypothetical protein